MIEKDTVRLLRECDAGIRMGVASIEQVLGHVQSAELKKDLADNMAAHKRLGFEVRSRLDRFDDRGKAPNPIALRMSEMMTGMKLAVNGTDSTVADLMTDGCNMGVKSLNRYLNRYKAADEYTKDVTKRLIQLEQKLTQDVRGYL